MVIGPPRLAGVALLEEEVAAVALGLAAEALALDAARTEAMLSMLAATGRGSPHVVSMPLGPGVGCGCGYLFAAIPDWRLCLIPDAAFSPDVLRHSSGRSVYDLLKYPAGSVSTPSSRTAAIPSMRWSSM